MTIFTVLPALVLVGFIITVLYKHFVKKKDQNLKASFLFVLFFLGIWALLYYLVFA